MIQFPVFRLRFAVYVSGKKEHMFGYITTLLHVSCNHRNRTIIPTTRNKSSFCTSFARHWCECAPSYKKHCAAKAASAVEKRRRKPLYNSSRRGHNHRGKTARTKETTDAMHAICPKNKTAKKRAATIFFKYISVEK